MNLNFGFKICLRISAKNSEPEITAVSKNTEKIHSPGYEEIRQSLPQGSLTRNHDEFSISFHFLNSFLKGR